MYTKTAKRKCHLLETYQNDFDLWWLFVKMSLQNNTAQNICNIISSTSDRVSFSPYKSICAQDPLPYVQIDGAYRYWVNVDETGNHVRWECTIGTEKEGQKELEVLKKLLRKLCKVALINRHCGIFSTLLNEAGTSEKCGELA